MTKVREGLAKQEREREREREHRVKGGDKINTVKLMVLRQQYESPISEQEYALAEPYYQERRAP